jgi:hypothetical protein
LPKTLAAFMTTVQYPYRCMTVSANAAYANYALIAMLAMPDLCEVRSRSP